MANDAATSKSPGLVLRMATAYDLGVWLLTLGRERAFREKLLAPARLRAGETVLDVGCGTGSLALEAKRQVGSRGTVHGIDASPEMIARAVRKARKADLEVELANASAQALPFADGRFDAIVSTLVFHHLPRSSRERCALEMRRVAKPGGRVLVVDFARSTRKSPGLLDHLHRHGGVAPDEIAGRLEGAGMEIAGRGELGVMGLGYVLATVPVGSR